MATSVTLRFHHLLLLFMVSYAIMFELFSHRFLEPPSLPQELQGERGFTYCSIPAFCNIHWEEAGWVSEMFHSQESLSHDTDMDWIQERTEAVTSSSKFLLTGTYFRRVADMK